MRAVRVLASQPTWFISLVVVGFALAFGLILLGAKGNEIAGPLALGVGIIGIAVALLAAPWRSRNGSDSDEDVSEDDEGDGAPDPPTGRRIVVVLSAIVLLGAAGGGTAYSTLVHKRDLRAADQIVAVANEGLVGNEVRPASFTLRPALDGRAYISFRIEVVNVGGSGNCEGQTRLAVAPLLDGSRGVGEIADVISGQEFEVDVSGATHGGVAVRTSGQPPPCTVNLYVAEAVAHNKFPW